MSLTTTPKCSSGSTNKVSNQQVQSLKTNNGHDINWRDNYIRTKLYAHRDTNVDQSAYDALVVSLLSTPKPFLAAAGKSP